MAALRVKATATLEARLPIRRAMRANDWPLMLSEFVAGQVTETALFAGTAASTPDMTKDRECEAYFYAPWVRLLNHDTAGARDLLTKSMATGQRRNLEWSSARAELAALGAG